MTSETIGLLRSKQAQIAELSVGPSGNPRLIDVMAVLLEQSIPRMMQQYLDPENRYGDEYWETLCEEELLRT